MEYHDSRFMDHSIIVLDNSKWVAILPANCVDNKLYSHQGLTYGGLIYNEELKLAAILLYFQAILEYLHVNRIEKLEIKSIPNIYHKKPSDEILYALFLCKGNLFRRDTLAVIDLKIEFVIDKSRFKGINRGFKNNLIVKEETSFELFWNEILIPNLATKHNTKPVHTLEEITKLKKHFPNQIRQFNVYLSNEIVAGTTIFESDKVAHSQYISSDFNKNTYGCLDFLHYELITKYFKHKSFFDFGISNENQGRKLNNGLSYWKESFGSNTIVQDFYEIDTQNYHFLNNVIF